jgi:hypothetical protein
MEYIQSFQYEAATHQLYESLLTTVLANQKYAAEMADQVAAAQAVNQDLPGDVGQSFYLGFAANSYALVSSLINNGYVRAYLQIANSGLYLNSIISLENLNTILPYCGDTTYDG